MKIYFFHESNCDKCRAEEVAIKCFADEHGIEIYSFDGQEEEGILKWLSLNGLDMDFYKKHKIPLILPMIFFVDDLGKVRHFDYVLQLERFLGAG
jgi:thiol-disulfide isomerase/thioredoxin